MGEDPLVKPDAPETALIARLLGRAGINTADALLAWDVHESRWLTVVGIEAEQSRLAVYSRIADLVTSEAESDRIDDVLLVDRDDPAFGKLKATARRPNAQPSGASALLEGRELFDPVRVMNRAAAFEAEVLHELNAMAGIEPADLRDSTNRFAGMDAVIRSGGMTWCIELKTGNLPVSTRSVVQLAGWVHLLQEGLGRPVRGLLIVEAPLTVQARELLSSAPDLGVIDWSQPRATEELRAAIA